jgi:N-acetylneuraminate synthase
MDKVFYIAEIGINHNGDLEVAKQIIDAAVDAGADAVKFQKRNPDLAVPEAQKSVMRETPWGMMTYLNYKRRIEFGKAEYDELDRYCKEQGIKWFASAWDIESQQFLRQYNLEYNKIASAMLTYTDLLEEVAAEGKHTFISTGMSTAEEVDTAIEVFRKHLCPFTVFQCTSTYPAALNELDLRVVSTFQAQYPDSIGVGYSNHSPGILAPALAVSLGATHIEAHCTMRRNAWGTDQSNSLEPDGLKRMIRDCNNVSQMLGSSTKQVFASEVPIKNKLRKV